ncbi:hypothetical protein D3227_18705 [Mesorhizobium waimense]|uniref:Uncharacterized protein n=1 Tax=Mesorhizobium waimense TaxID=1300307 RepID=A0A3A5KWZ9_9HYPH|nr:hypothetical protein D3227_18705 [Mesorhizobium waimense]
MARKAVEIDQIHRSMFPSVQATATILVNETAGGVRRIIASQAKIALQPAGFRRKGNLVSGSLIVASG